ncbi:MAG TPA: histidinol phosphate phosphatase domain-containing protein [Candidatus Dormibacteraeota bacterium]|nr:histidinol phosphate phosphatase domain-containing protein [Candidatus Dormibacteraeota bacterium]
MALFDFHTHTTLSDGSADPLTMARRCLANGYGAYVCSDHVDDRTVADRVPQIVAACRQVAAELAIPAIPAVEITRVDASLIARVAAAARRLGAELVVVHGETLGDRPQPGVNLAAVRCAEVDILAHPGLITAAAAAAARETGVLLEVTAANFHGMTNGHVVRIATAEGAALLIDSDAHRPEALLTSERIDQVLVGSGLTPEQAAAVRRSGPVAVLARRGIVLPQGAATSA